MEVAGPILFTATPVSTIFAPATTSAFSAPAPETVADSNLLDVLDKAMLSERALVITNAYFVCTELRHLRVPSLPLIAE